MFTGIQEVWNCSSCAHNPQFIYYGVVSAEIAGSLFFPTHSNVERNLGIRWVRPTKWYTRTSFKLKIFVETAVVSFRGSDNIRNDIVDVDILWDCDYEDMADVCVHSGFYHGWLVDRSIFLCDNPAGAQRPSCGIPQ